MPTIELDFHGKGKWFCPRCGSSGADPQDDWYDGDYYYEVIACSTCGCEWENEYVYVKTNIEEDEL